MTVDRVSVLPLILGIITGIAITSFISEQIFIKSTTKRDVGAFHKIQRKYFNEIYQTVDFQSKMIYKDDPMPAKEKLSFENLRPRFLDDEIEIRQQLYVGVITAEKYLPTRATAVNKTWGQEVDKLEFFAELGSSEQYHLPVLNLEGISDKEYPPQKKAFKMIKHMCKHVDEYEWFVRADDDVYIRVEKLRKLISDIDSDIMVYMGQPGHGVPEVRDKLGLKGRNFCMGGPGVFFNRIAMKALCPHIDDCIQEVVSTEEDVEIGRCVSNHIGIECTHAWQTLKYFYHSYQEEYKEEKPFLGNLAENNHVENAITLHHVKVPHIMYKIHKHYAMSKLNSTQHDIKKLEGQINYNNLYLPKYQQIIPKTPFLVGNNVKNRFSPTQQWQSFDVSSVYGLSISSASTDITNSYLADLKQICETAIDSAIRWMSNDMSFNHISGGFIRSDPIAGTQYLVDVVFNNKKGSWQASRKVTRVKLLRPLNSVVVTTVHTTVLVDKEKDIQEFYIVLPIKQEQSAQLEFFLIHYMEPLLDEVNKEKKSKVILIVSVLNTILQSDFDGEKKPTVQDIINWYRIKLPQFDIELLQLLDDYPDAANSDELLSHAYSMGVSKASILSTNAPNSYIIFTAVHMSLSKSFLQICHDMSTSSNNTHTIVQAVPFQLFPTIPQSVYKDRSSGSNFKLNNDFIEQNVNKNFGYWHYFRNFDKSIHSELSPPFCMTANDLLALKNTKYKPNIPLFPRLVKSVYSGEFEIFRYPDRDLINFPMPES